MSEWHPPNELEEYRLVRLLGRGAMGKVYLAHDTLLDRHVAVKFVDAVDTNERVFEEARAIARLQHPNVVAIYRVAETAGHPYLVSEYVRGRSLDTLDRPVSPKLVLQLAIDLTRGLAAAHRSGVLHRDVKPANAILTDDGRGKLLDFGLARIVDGKEPSPEPPRERSTQARHLASIDATVSSPVRVVAAPPVDAIDSINAPLASSGSGVARSLAEGSPDRGVGTPLYMAPELWRGEPATRRSDLYALGILMYELLAGTAPHRGIPIAELGDAIQQRDVPRLGAVMPDLDPALAAIVDRLVERNAGARFASADALLVALEECAAPPPALAVPDGNPYRGLAVFESGHGALFFGRRGEIRELVDRITVEPLVVVGGDSGTGKSSVCRAGVLPWLVENEGWTRVDVVPGRYPVRSLAVALAPWTGSDEHAFAALMRETPDAVARAIRGHAQSRRLLLFVDQLEELLTIAEPDEAEVAAAAIGALAVHTPSVRVLATARSDFLSRLAMLPSLGDEIGRALYFLRPLSGDRLREAIVRPAAVKGVRFESDALVETLVAQTEHAPGGLPLLQFALAELWDARDTTSKTIQSDALVAIGGVEGALARHADRVIAGLDANEREAARRLLLRLVTADGTRARRAEGELLSDGVERRVLEVLVRGRIVVANDAAYEIAHEALLTSWTTLHEWRQRGAADRAVQRRVELAAAEWDRAGRPRDLLWRRRQLAETRALERDNLGPRETAFLDAARRSVVKRRVAAAGVVTALVGAAVAIALTVRAHARHEVERAIAERVQLGTSELAKAHELAARRDATRERAFRLYDDRRWAEGEDTWAEAEAIAADETASYRAASSQFESAWLLDPTREDLRARLAGLLYERVLRAERDRNSILLADLSGRLALLDDGRHRAELDANARLELAVSPPDAQVWIERTGAPRERLGHDLRAELKPGHVVLVIEAPAHAAVRFPVLLTRGVTAALDITLPPASTVPADMIYVPRGRFLFGGTENTDLRRGFLSAAPAHTIETGAYLIGRHEVTFAEWIAFLDELTPSERKIRTPNVPGSLELLELSPKRWQLRFTREPQTYVAAVGERFHYEGRTRRADQDWLRFPVSAISFDDAAAYTAWLDRTNRVPNARLCDETEWERAARGADARTFPHGETLTPDDANFDVTYGRVALAYGPDEVGSHPASRSPVGADDAAGNVWEWVRSAEDPGAPLARGGSWYNASIAARTANREPTEPTQRRVDLGLRICATPSATPNSR